MVRVGGFSGNPNVVVTPYGSSTSPIEGIEFNDGVLRVGSVQVTTDGFGAEAGRHFRAADDITVRPASPPKLRQIQEARDAGLISQEEYDKLRQEILDNMG
ncbi:MAG: SHOCT domain-containing protein [Anaerolineae bacterium]